MTTLYERSDPADAAIGKQTVRDVYEQLAAEYDERIPGAGHADDMFTDSEMRFLMSKVHSGTKVLDMGCGTGRFTVPLALAGADMTGLDLTAAMLDQARAKAKAAEVDIEFRQGDMASLPFPDNSFEVVTSMLALMHIPLSDRQSVFSEVARVLKPGGRMLLCVKNGVFERMFSGDRFAEVDVTDVENKELVFTQTQAGEELRAPWFSFTPDELTLLFARAGMSVTHLKGNSPISVWLSEQALADKGIRSVVQTLEATLSDVPPFNHLGYHLLIEAAKPL
ncbi:class I SAM-dependent methyltransferase [Amycolatopsis sp. cmx-11-51]|uniref:class I SAM-dependent methyltransferase n=1 Tax=unclassified Amycolatopsis TaxID=2618356 RepID=UPI0039E40FAA